MPQEEFLRAVESSAKEILRLTEGETESERQLQINKARRNEQFWKQNHFVAPAWSTDGTAEYTPIQFAYPDSEKSGQIKFCYPFNMYRGLGLKWRAVASNAAPSIKIESDDPEDKAKVQAARDAQVIASDLGRKWDLKELQRELAEEQYVTGPVFGLTEFVADGDKYGWVKEPQYSEPTPDNPVPAVTGFTDYPNGDVELNLYNCLYVTIEFPARNLKQSGYLKLRYMEDSAKLLSIYRDRLPEDNPAGAENNAGTGADTMAAEAIDAEASPLSVGRPIKKGQWPYTRLWIRPYKYHLISDKALREQARTLYPDGACFVWVGDNLVEIKHQRIDELWSVCKPGTGKRILSDPVCQDGIPFQKALNDFFNLAIETVLRAIPKTIVDQSLLDRKATQDAEALPAEVIFTKIAYGQDISKLIAKLPVAEFSQQLMPLAESLTGMMQDVLGIRPELWGGGAPTQTFAEAKQRKDQARGVLQPVYEETLRFWERALENGIRQKIKYGSGSVRSADKPQFGAESRTVDVETISATGWHAEAENGFPQTWDEEAGMLRELLSVKDGLSPQMQEAIGINRPSNIPRIHQLLGLRGLKAPMEDLIHKVEDTIERLLGEAPIQDVDPNTGQPSEKPAPSIPPDEFEDANVHDIIADLVREFLWRRGAVEKERNRPGYDNVVAWGEAHAAMVPSQQAQPEFKKTLSVTTNLERLSPQMQESVLVDAGISAQGASQGPNGESQPLATDRPERAVVLGRTDAPQPEPTGEPEAEPQPVEPPEEPQPVL